MSEASRSRSTGEIWKGVTFHNVPVCGFTYQQDIDGPVTEAYVKTEFGRGACVDFTNHYGPPDTSPTAQAKQPKNQSRAHLDHMRTGRRKY